MWKNRIKKSFEKYTIVKIIGILFFVTINIVWYIGSYSQYAEFQSILNEHSEKGDGVVIDEEGYSYSVKKPGYLLWSEGNLAIASSLEKTGEELEDGRALHISKSSIIIWMKHFHKGVDEVGVILTQDGMSRQIYLTDNETARYEDAQPYVDAGQDEINKLFRKVEKEWNIEMPWKK